MIEPCTTGMHHSMGLGSECSQCGHKAIFHTSPSFYCQLCDELSRIRDEYETAIGELRAELEARMDELTPEVPTVDVDDEIVDEIPLLSRAWKEIKPPVPVFEPSEPEREAVRRSTLSPVDALLDQMASCDECDRVTNRACDRHQRELDLLKTTIKFTFS